MVHLIKFEKMKKSHLFRLASFIITNTLLAPCFSMLYFSLSARIGFISQAVICASLFVYVAICVVFPPGAAHISKISLFFCGSNIIGGSIEDKLCK